MTDAPPPTSQDSGSNRLLLGIATLGPLGTFCPAPGTFGSLAGALAFLALLEWSHLPPSYILWGFTLLALLAIPICSAAERILCKRDPGEVIIDEFVAMPLVFWSVYDILITLEGTLEKLTLTMAGFVLFRIFDIWKPLGINRLQVLPKGIGVVVDDLGAAFAAGLCLWIFT
ncbi:MAG: phosphatidylglycerophosphatase A [Opitutae bacterium]|nr:phosphatidylglycerophosphatase A [Opitutae bacterium]